jgi:hypothetical protein
VARYAPSSLPARRGLSWLLPPALGERRFIQSPRRRVPRAQRDFTIARSARRRASAGALVSPGTTDSLVARKAKAAHQINPVVAQSKIGGRALDRFYARDFNFRQGRCRSLARSQRPRPFRMCCKRPCRSHAYKQRDELASSHQSQLTTPCQKHDLASAHKSALTRSRRPLPHHHRNGKVLP